MRSLYKIAVLAVLCVGVKCYSVDAPVVRQAEDVFKNWIGWQNCYSNYCFDNMPDRMNEFFNQRFKRQYLKHKSKLTTLVPFLNDISGGFITENGDLVGSELEDDFRENFSTVYQLIENNMPRFLDYLKDHKFISSQANDQEDNASDVNTVIEKYRALTRLLFPNFNKSFERKMQFCFANRCFSYCFGASTWDDFKRHLDTPQDHQLIRFLYSTIWQQLVGLGWKDWAEPTLQSIIQASAGKRVVYVAGGADIYQLLKNGVYNIDVIDPFLPSQEKYYASSDWDWLVKGRGKKNGLGDKILFDFDGKKIEMVRSKYSRKGSFVAKLSTNKKRTIEQSVTYWDVLDENKKLLGDVTFYRRFCNQSDFFTGKERLILMSLNELYYAFLPESSSGWNMKISKLPQDFKIYVKQLLEPIDSSVLKNIQRADASNFNFINFGSDPT